MSASDPIRLQITKVNSLIAPLDDGKRVTYLDLSAKFIDEKGNLIADPIPETTKAFSIWADAMQSEIDKVFPKL
jgi:hypothetical protein